MQALPLSICSHRASAKALPCPANANLVQRRAVRCRHVRPSHTASAHAQRHMCRAQTSNGAAGTSTEATFDAEDDEQTEEALEAKMQEFLRQQAQQESGDAYVAPAAAGSTVLGADTVTDEDARIYCQEIRDTIKILKSNRDMAFNEIKLTVAIEDPRARERRENLGIEDESGVSRDELAAALQEVAEGRIPKDRLALRELAREMIEWPYKDLSTDSRLSQLKDAGVQEEPEGILRPRKLLGRDKNEAPQGITDLLPEWMGYGALYAVSAAPIVIGVGVVVILFVNSLK